MATPYYPEVVWDINKHLIVLCAFVAAADVLFVMLKGWFGALRKKKVSALEKGLHKMALTGKAAAPKDISKLIKQTNLAEFLEIMKHEKKMWVLPEEFELGLKDYLSISGRFGEMEKLARNSKSKWRRIQAIICLGYADDAAALNILKDSLKDKDEDVVYFSMLSLGQIKTEKSARLLLEFLEGNPAAGSRAITLLEKFPAWIAEEAIKATEHPNPDVRFWAVKLLARVQPKHLTRKIESLAQDEAPQVRSMVCDCLGRIGDHGAKDVVAQRLKDPVWYVRRRAVKALSRVLGGECMPLIVELIRDENIMVRDAVKKAMVHDFKVALPYLEKYIHDDHGPLRKDCVEVLEDAGYLNVLFDELLTQEGHRKAKATELLRGIVNSGAHIGLESTLAGFDAGPRDLLLHEIAKIDEDLSEHIRQKIEHLMAEI